MGTGTIIFLIYSIWALVSGYKWVNGRYAWLEQDGLSRKICKIFAVLGVGYVIGAFLFCGWIIKLAFRITDG